MAKLSSNIDYLEYIGRYKNRYYWSQTTWVELEEGFNQLVAKYAQTGPNLTPKVVKYSALYRLIETYWPVEEQFPDIDAFSFQSAAWPSDASSAPRFPPSTGYHNAGVELQAFADGQSSSKLTQGADQSSGVATEISRAGGELAKAAEKLSHISRELSKAFE